MASVQIHVLRNTADYGIIIWSPNPIVPQSGQEDITVTVPDEDLVVFYQKYKFDNLGNLVINGKYFYRLSITHDGLTTNPVTGYPQLTVGDATPLNVTLTKMDLDDNLVTGVDTIYINVISGERGVESVDLVNGVVTGQIMPGTVKGLTEFQFTCDNIASASFFVETIS